MILSGKRRNGPKYDVFYKTVELIFLKYTTNFSALLDADLTVWPLEQYIALMASKF